MPLPAHLAVPGRRRPATFRADVALPPSTDPAEAEAEKKGIVPIKGAAHATQFTPTQQITISTGIGFLDHMLHALAKHGGWSLAVRAKGDFRRPPHRRRHFPRPRHGLHKSPRRPPIPRPLRPRRRPLDEALSWAVIDLSSRPWAVINLGFKREKIGDLSTEMITHGLQSFAQAADVTLHVGCTYGDNDHHRAESAFKALAVAIRAATARRVEGEVGAGDIVSTKGVL
ncbi:Imidazoleglycerol-phosphate dehydratase [Penicillium cataractarum]|uniref:Imidazoleglycerol-phosphate dehydratase n=1 Tax=Penicillium cataractarum TaxID=2100454 RepID=A0A9W9RE96_9EURO|nr:Imidazoleglycerol-phosphate dehydratase [Penicillium cataractarum]KAJ5358427.1 Imidazoleglycerol-phosphate dehydratase [Penicillium cataractarum]